MTKQQWVFEVLVKNDKDMLGLIAYALYKHRKHTLAKELRSKNSSEPDIQKAVDDFHNHVLQSGMTAIFQEQAAKFISSAYNEIEKEFERKKSNEIRKFIHSAQKQSKEYQSRREYLLDKSLSTLLSSIWALIFSVLFIGSVHILFNEENRREIMASAVGKYFSMGEVAKEYQSARPDSGQAQVNKGAS